MTACIYFFTILLVVYQVSCSPDDIPEGRKAAVAAAVWAAARGCPGSGCYLVPAVRVGGCGGACRAQRSADSMTEDSHAREKRSPINRDRIGHHYQHGARVSGYYPRPGIPICSGVGCGGPVQYV